MYKLIKRGQQFNSPVKKIICNTYEESNNIKGHIPFGSVLYTIDDNKYYIYNSKRQWIVQKGTVNYV